MSSSTTELGVLRLSHRGARVSLTSTPSVTATFSRHSESERRAYPQGDSFQWLQSGDRWVRRGQGMRLQLEIRMDGSPCNPGLARHLSERICEADLWSQLHLQATLPLQNEMECHGSVVVMLAHSHTDPPTNRKTRHRLGAGGQVSDVRPPSGIPLIGLELVKLAIEVERDWPSSPFVADPSDTEYEMMLEEVKTIGPRFACPLLLQKESRNDMLFDGADTSNSGHTPTFELSDLNVGEQTSLSIDHLLELIDAALRLAICDKPANLSRSILKVQDDCSPKLASLAPSMWCPGFLPAISQCAVFLTTIADVLIQPTLSSVRSSSLRSKLAKLPLTPNSGVHEGTGGPSCAFDATIIRLWFLLQRRLLNVNAAKQLRPLDSSAVNGGASLSDETEILEHYSSQVSFFNEGLNDCQDLFETEAESFPAYADDALSWRPREIPLEDEETGDDVLIEEHASRAPLFGMHTNYSADDLMLL